MLVERHRKEQSLDGYGGGAFCNCEDRASGILANATITLQSQPTKMHFNSILIRVRRGCRIAAGEEIFVDAQSYAPHHTALGRVAPCPYGPWPRGSLSILPLAAWLPVYTALGRVALCPYCPWPRGSPW